MSYTRKAAEILAFHGEDGVFQPRNVGTSNIPRSAPGGLEAASRPSKGFRKHAGAAALLAELAKGKAGVLERSSLALRAKHRFSGPRGRGGGGDVRGKTSTYAGLDFVRFGAAALVALYHFAFQERGQTFAVGGWVGVPIFFVISGFVIAFSADQKSAGQFVFSRFLRLYPAAWICATLTAAVTTPPLPNYLGSLVLSPVGPWVSPVYWTLGVEMSFYALVALCVWRWGSASLVPLGIALGAYSAVAWLVKIALNLDAIETQLGYLTLWNNGCLFALGIMLWARRWLIASAFAVVSLCAVAATSKGLALGHMWEAPLIWLVALALIVASVVWRRELEPLAPLARTIGLMTYPLYLIHAEVGGAVLDRTNSILAALAVSILAAFIVLPLERMIRGLFLPRRAQGATLVTPGPETH